MLGISFIVASYLLSKEFKRRNLGENNAINITFIALIGGVVGAKLLYVIEEWGSISSMPSGKLFSTDGLFSPAGLTYYGGFIITPALLFFFTPLEENSFLSVVCSTSPSLAIRL